MPLTDSNARSIKTRIETTFQLNVSTIISFIRMQDPLKQGLQLSSLPGRSCEAGQDSNARSIKTRIETTQVAENDTVILPFECKIH